MAARSSAPTRMEILILSSLARRPMHGYEIKTELRDKHVEWWAKCDHGHLYATLPRLEQRGFIEQVEGKGRQLRGRARRVFALTEAGERYLKDALRQTGASTDTTYFDFDLFLQGTPLIGASDVSNALRERRAGLLEKLDEARALDIPTEGGALFHADLIIRHRIGHIERELAFLDDVERALTAEVEQRGKNGTQVASSRA